MRARDEVADHDDRSPTIWSPTRSPAERTSCAAACRQLDDRLFMMVEVPVQTPFTLDVMFDRLEELAAGLDRVRVRRRSERREAAGRPGARAAATEGRARSTRASRTWASSWARTRSSARSRSWRPSRSASGRSAFTRRSTKRWRPAAVPSDDARLAERVLQHIAEIGTGALLDHRRQHRRGGRSERAADPRRPADAARGSAVRAAAAVGVARRAAGRDPRPRRVSVGRLARAANADHDADAADRRPVPHAARAGRRDGDAPRSCRGGSRSRGARSIASRRWWRR